ncbi:MAG: Tim44-like domain-containing protein [Xanthobacteraceae bacterium]|nr:Tim44-like domain-containing protein [Xanthobacteraceae bacterium]
MTFLRRPRGIVQTLALTMALAFPLLMIAVSAADARAGRGGSAGSRGSRTFSAPATTPTAPNAAQPFNRTMTQPGTTAPRGAAAAGNAARPGMGMMGGLMAGLLGAGLIGMLFGGGLFSGLGSLSSFLGLALQIIIIVMVARFAMAWWRRRNANTAAYEGPANGPAPAGGPQTNLRNGLGGLGAGLGAGLGGGPGAAGGGSGLGGGAAASTPLQITPDDYEAFERLLGEVQAAWSDEDVEKLHKLATPEMVSYFTEDLAANKQRGVVNKVTGVKLLQGDLAEAWREGVTDFATVAMRFSLTDKTVDRASGNVVDGGDTPVEATEVWTFARRPGEGWELSAIQQA